MDMPVVRENRFFLKVKVECRSRTDKLTSQCEYIPAGYTTKNKYPSINQKQKLISNITSDRIIDEKNKQTYCTPLRGRSLEISIRQSPMISIDQLFEAN